MVENTIIRTYFQTIKINRMTINMIHFNMNSKKGERIDMLVKVFANLRVICGGVSVNVEPDGDRVMDVLDKMIEMFPDLKDEIYTEEKKLKPFVHLYVNGRNIIHAEDLETRVKETDQLALFPPVAGG